MVDLIKLMINFIHIQNQSILKPLDLLGGCDISKKKRDIFSNIYKTSI